MEKRKRYKKGKKKTVQKGKPKQYKGDEKTQVIVLVEGKG